MILTSEENNQYTAEVRLSRVEFYQNGVSLGIANFERVSGARKVLSCLALTGRPLEEVLCFYRASEEFVGAKMTDMSFSDDGRYVLCAGKIIATS